MKKESLFERAQLYLEKQYDVIPIGQDLSRPKACIISQWDSRNDFSQKEWESANGIGLRFKKDSPIMAIDRDSLDVEIQKAIRQIMPPPLCERFSESKKDSTIFFSKSLSVEIPKRKEFKNLGIEFLHSGSYCGIELFIKGKNYYRFGKNDLLSLDFDSLPVLSLEIIEQLRQLNLSFEKSENNLGFGPLEKGRCRHESHNVLSRILLSMAQRGESKETIIKELMAIDEKYNLESDFYYFNCPQRREFKKKTREEACLWFINDMCKRNHISLPENGSNEIVIIEHFEDKEPTEEELFHQLIANVKDISPQGEIKRLQEQIVENGFFQRPHAVLLSLLGLFGNISSKYRCFSTYEGNDKILSGITSNLYTLDVALSGNGKSSSFSFFSLLSPEIPELCLLIKDRNTKSLAGYHSALTLDPRPLYLIDEISEVFQSGNNKNGHSHGIYEAFNGDFWDKRTFHYVSLKESSYGICYNPRVSFISATTVNGFLETLSDGKYLQGIGRRLLINIDNDRHEKERIFQGEILDIEQIKSLQGHIKVALNAKGYVPCEQLCLVKGIDKNRQQVFWHQAPTYFFKAINFTENARHFMETDLLKLENDLVLYCPIEKLQAKFGSLIELSIKVSMAYSLGKRANPDAREILYPISLEEIQWASNFVLRSFISEYEFYRRNDQSFKQAKFNRDAESLMEILNNDFSRLDEGNGVFIRQMNRFRTACSRKKIKPLDIVAMNKNLKIITEKRSNNNALKIIDATGFSR